ncbi:hypothetical protein FWF89_01355 [Candidatus Saccharibacteria bacterium]|nr:hypothetical protein [Candidatus Saccharibacteria bacterium]
MKIKRLRPYIVAALLAIIGLGTIMSADTAFADGTPPTGGLGGSGSGSGGGGSCGNLTPGTSACCFYGYDGGNALAQAQRCPHYILGTIAEFEQAWKADEASNERTYATGIEAYRTCTNKVSNTNTSGMVIWVGYDGSYPKSPNVPDPDFRLRNFVSGSLAKYKKFSIFPSGLGSFPENVYKDYFSHPQLDSAGSILHVNNLKVGANHAHDIYDPARNPGGWWDSIVPGQSSLTDAYGTYPYTYFMLMQLVMNSLKISTDDQLAFFCVGLGTPQGARVDSKSTVRVGSGASSDTNWVDRATANASMTVDSGATVTVTFNHDMRFVGPLPQVQVQKAWTNNLETSGSIVSMSAASPAVAMSGTYIPTAANQNGLTVVSPHTYTVVMPTVAYGASRQTVTICERLVYQNKTLGTNNQWSGGESFSRACAVITVSPVNTACMLPIPAGHIATEDEGRTVGLSAARNMTTAAGTWKQGISADNIVWAKPGDSVQFMHCLFPGAQSTRVSTYHGAEGGHSPTANGPKTQIVAGAGTCNILADPSQSYFFGTQRSTDCKEVATGDPTERVIYSPSTGNTAFSCFIQTSGFAASVPGGYQVPGFASRPSGCHSISISDLGKTIKQTMTYNGTVYTKNRNEGRHGWYHTDCWSCGCDEYGCDTCCDTHYVTHTNDYFSVAANQSGTVNTYGMVKIPYNYNTSISVTITQTPVVYGGSDVNVGSSVSIDRRRNIDVYNNNEGYATMTKPTFYDVVMFIVPPSTPFTSIAHSSDGSDPANRKLVSAYPTACSYYRQGASECRRLDSSIQNLNNLTRAGTDKIRFNPDSNLRGLPSINIFNKDVAIPDYEVGTKFCVAVGVWPADSHNYTTGPAGVGEVALLEAGTIWNFSEPTCRTIGKKPSVQFRSAGVYTTGPISTSQSKKVPLAGGYVPTGELSALFSSNVQNDNRRVFGSWSEYEAIARQNTVEGFASGAAFGYDLNNRGNPTAISTTTSDYFNVKHANQPELCTYSTQTFSNNSCNTNSTVGKSTINSMSNTILNRLISRYTAPNHPPTQVSGARITTGGACSYDANGNLQPPENASYICLQNGARYVKINGDATFYGGPDSAAATYSLCKLKSASGRYSNTTVYDISGTLTIDGNLVYGNVSGTGCIPETYESIAQLPQYIIFAGDVIVTSRVTNIDAWLIVGKNGTGSGKINTCGRIDVNSSNLISFSDLTSTICNRTLTINGPVFANELILNRTAGAGIGSESIVPAEIFNLRADTFLWAYNQAQRFSQAVTTYTRELAPRY